MNGSASLILQKKYLQPECGLLKACFTENGTKGVCKYGMNNECGLLVNSSRGIIYASQNTDFAEVAAEKAKELQIQMDAELTKHGI